MRFRTMNLYDDGGQADERAVPPDAPERLLGILRTNTPQPEKFAPGLDARSEGYFGKEGQLAAMLAFGHALAGQRGRDVTLCFNDMDSLEDKDWERVAATLFRKGHRYHIALASPERMLPERALGLAGEVFVYDMPKEAKAFGLLLSAPRLGTVISGIGSEQTLIIWDNAALCCHEGLFTAFLPSGKPAAHAYGPEERPEDPWGELLEDEGPLVFARDSLNGFFVPSDLLPETDSAERAAQAGRLAAQRELFSAHADGAGWTEVLPKVLLEAVSLNQSCRFSAAALLGRQDIILRGAALRAALQTMLGCLDLYPSYRVVWTEQASRIWTLVSPSRGALLCDYTKPARYLRLFPRDGCFGLRVWADAFPKDPDRGRAPLRAALEGFI